MSKPISAKDNVASSGSGDPREITGTTCPDPSDPSKEKRYLDVKGLVESQPAATVPGDITRTVAPATPSTEFSVTIPAGTSQFHLRPDTAPRWEYSYTSGGEFMRVGIGGVLERVGLNVPTGGVTIYIKCLKASEPFKLEVWS